MGTPAKLIGAGAVAAASAGILASVRSTPVDVVDGTVLVASLVALARTAIRRASDPDGGRGPGRS